MECCLEMLDAIDKKHGVFDIVLLRSSCRNRSVNAVVDVENSRIWRILFVSGSTVAYSQYR